MAEERSLEMRIAAIEDKLANLNISEEDLRVYNRVSAQLAGRAGSSPCVAAQSFFSCAIICYCNCHIYNPPCVNDCIPFYGGVLGAGGIGAQFRTLGRQQEED
jgi:hypothetical protein